jgi:hypothetical protein
MHKTQPVQFIQKKGRRCREPVRWVKLLHAQGQRAKTKATTGYSAKRSPLHKCNMPVSGLSYPLYELISWQAFFIMADYPCKRYDNSRVSRASRWAGGLGGVTTVTWRSRRRVTPSDSRTQRHGWAASGSRASRVALSSNETTTSHGLCKLEIAVIVDSRVLDLYFILF